MKIIDFDRKGNTVRFYLGEHTNDWGWVNKDYLRNGEKSDWVKPEEKYYGDDWSDTPYEHNAGTVYDYFVKGTKDIAFNFDDLVLEPCDGAYYNSDYSKDDMVDRKIPCIIVVPKDAVGDSWEDSFDYWNQIDDPRIKKYYFGDTLEKDK